MTDQRNAKTELLSSIEAGNIKCAIVRFAYDPEDTIFVLPPNYTAEMLTHFLNCLDVDYDSGFGGQELFGVVWHKDNKTWLERGEYDGQEWWETMCLLDLPDFAQEDLNKWLEDARR